MNFNCSKPWWRLCFWLGVVSALPCGHGQDCDLVIDGPAAGKRCTFPFEFQAIRYFACTTVTDPNNKPWCSTKTFPNGTHIGGQGNWGHCKVNCQPFSNPSQDQVHFGEPRVEEQKFPRRTTRPSFRRTTKPPRFISTPRRLFPTSRPTIVTTTTTITPTTTTTTTTTTTPVTTSFIIKTFSTQRSDFVRASDWTSGLWLPDPSLGECGYGFNTDYITGGKIAKVGEFPFMALLGLQQRNGKIIYGCGGTLINRRYVLTAAHCQSNKIPIRQVVLGETDTSKDRDCFDCPLVQRFTIRSSDVQVHEDYTPEGVFGQGNDIALIRLPSLAKTVYDSFDIKVGPACLPWKQEAVGDLRVIGWGRYSNNLGIIRKNLDRFSVNSNNLLYAELENIPYSRCRSFKEFERVHPTRHICAAGRNGGDSCNGDSGGPLIAHDRSRDVMYIKGIVSYGANACGKGTPGVYLNVREYLPWILSRLRD